MYVCVVFYFVHVEMTHKHFHGSIQEETVEKKGTEREKERDALENI